MGIAIAFIVHRSLLFFPYDMFLLLFHDALME